MELRLRQTAATMGCASSQPEHANVKEETQPRREPSPAQPGPTPPPVRHESPATGVAAAAAGAASASDASSQKANGEASTAPSQLAPRRDQPPAAEETATTTTASAASGVTGGVQAASGNVTPSPAAAPLDGSGGSQPEQQQEQQQQQQQHEANGASTAAVAAAAPVAAGTKVEASGGSSAEGGLRLLSAASNGSGGAARDTAVPPHAHTRPQPRHASTHALAHSGRTLWPGLCMPAWLLIRLSSARRLRCAWWMGRSGRAEVHRQAHGGHRLPPRRPRLFDHARAGVGQGRGTWDKAKMMFEVMRPEELLNDLHDLKFIGAGGYGKVSGARYACSPGTQAAASSSAPGEKRAAAFLTGRGRDRRKAARGARRAGVHKAGWCLSRRH